jgi:hypothetical protein
MRGITFVDQKVTPQDDGRLYAAIFEDGIIYGCKFSSAGYTLTISSGHMIIAGKQVKFPSAQNIAVSGATEGYARIVLVIDLNQLSTETIFEQIYTRVEYSQAIDGFPALIQQDINGAGIKYQCELAICSLSKNGIDAIVSKIQTAEFKEAAI